MDDEICECGHGKELHGYADAEYCKRFRKCHHKADGIDIDDIEYDCGCEQFKPMQMVEITTKKKED